MGIVTDAHSRPLIYDHTKPDFTIREGIIVAKNKKAYDVCAKRIIEGLGKDIPTIHAEMLLDIDAKRKERHALRDPRQKKRVVIIDSQD